MSASKLGLYSWRNKSVYFISCCCWWFSHCVCVCVCVVTAGFRQVEISEVIDQGCSHTHTHTHTHTVFIVDKNNQNVNENSYEYLMTSVWWITQSIFVLLLLGLHFCTVVPLHYWVHAAVWGMGFMALVHLFCVFTSICVWSLYSSSKSLLHMYPVVAILLMPTRIIPKGNLASVRAFTSYSF